MRFREFLRIESFQALWVPDLELAPEMLPLVFQLPPRDLEGLGPDFSPADLPGIETIAPPGRFRLDFPQVRGDGGFGAAMLLEADELGVMLVAPGLFLQHGLCQQSLTPQSH